MECEKIKKMLPDYDSGVLSQEMENQIKVHLEKCEECKREQESYEKIWKILDKWRGIEPDPLHKARFWEKKEMPKDIYRGLYDFISEKRFVVSILTSLLLFLTVIFMFKAPDDLFNEPYLQRNGINISEICELGTLESNGNRFNLEIASILSLPEYVQYDEKDDLFGLEIDDKKIQILEGLHEAFLDLFTREI